MRFGGQFVKTQVMSSMLLLQQQGLDWVSSHFTVNVQKHNCGFGIQGGVLTTSTNHSFHPECHLFGASTCRFRPTVSSPFDLAQASCSLSISCLMWMACSASWMSKKFSCRSRKRHQVWNGFHGQVGRGALAESFLERSGLETQQRSRGHWGHVPLCWEVGG